MKTAAGDLICLFLERAVPPGLSVAETIAAVREQGGLVGIPHPFDGYRNSLLKDEGLASMAGLVDWVEVHNARIMVGDGNEKAAAFAAEHGLPGVAVSDAHTILEVAVASTILAGDPSTPAGLLAALPAAELTTGRATYFIRGVTPVAKLVQRLRGVRRVRRCPLPATGSTATFPRRRRAGMTDERDPRTPRGRCGVDRCRAARDASAAGTPGRRARIGGGRRGAGEHVVLQSPLHLEEELYESPAGSSARSPPTRCRSRGACGSRGRSSRSSCRSSSSSSSSGSSSTSTSRSCPRRSGRRTRCYLLAAFVVYYIGFPLRGYRWILLLRGTRVRIRTVDGTQIIFLSWLVNCLVPAKLGDVYRAYLLKINAPVSLSRTFGTVFIERILDLFVIAILGLAAGFWSFRSGLPPVDAVRHRARHRRHRGLLAAGLLTMRNFGRRLLNRLPVPRRVLDLYDRFEEGVFGGVGIKELPRLVVVTVIIWMTEAFRLWFVVLALGFPDVSLGLSGAAFVAFVGSLLTAVPLSPAGLGIVELGVVGVLTAAYGIPLQEATTIALVDRMISVFSVIVFGSVGYAFLPIRRGVGIWCENDNPTDVGAGPAAPATPAGATPTA